MKKSSVLNMNVANMNVASFAAPQTLKNVTGLTPVANVIPTQPKKGSKAMKTKPVELTAEELAMQTAKNVVTEARKAYTKELNEFKRVCTLTVVTDILRQEQSDKVVAAQKAERAAQNQLDLLVGKLEINEEAYNIFEVQTVNFDLTNDAIGKLIQLKEETNEKESQETLRKRGLVFGLVDLVNMNAGFDNIAAVDGKYGNLDNDYALAARSGLRMRIQDDSTKSKFEKIHHYVFGGQLGHMPISPAATLDFCAKGLEEAKVSLPALKESIESKFHAYSNSEYAEVKKTKRVFVGPKSVTIFCGNLRATLNWKEFSRKSSYLNQIVFIAKSAPDALGNSKYSLVGRSLTAMERLASLHLSGVDLSGLKENKDALAVVVVALGKKGIDSAQVAKVPFTHGISKLQLTPEMLAIQNILKRFVKNEDGSESDVKSKHSIGPVLNAEQYGKHGYVQLQSTYFQKATAFCDKHGNSFEDAAKLLVRLQKLAFNKSTIQYQADVHVIAGVDLKDVDASVNLQAQREFNLELARSLVGGNGIQSPELFKQIGTVRIVTGEHLGESGQKAMLGDAYYSSTNATTKIMKNIGLDKAFVLSGLNSTKAVVFKKGVDGWSQQFVTYKGKKVAYWVKSAPEILKITDSAVAEMWEINPDSIVALQHVAGAIDTLDRSVNGSKSASMMELLYNQREGTEDLYEAIDRLHEKGTIRPKKIHNKTNSQWNTGLEFQHGSDNAAAIIEFLIAQNRASEYRTNTLNSMFLMQGMVKDSDTATVNAESLIKSITETLLATGRMSNLESQVWDMFAVEKLTLALKTPNKKFVKLVFPSTGDSVTIPMTNEVLGSVENVARANAVRVSGLLAEILFAFSFFIERGTSEVDEETFEEKIIIDFNSNATKIVVEKIATARDKACRGKSLSQIPTIGANCFLITSAILHKNEMVSEKMMKAKKQAEYLYGQECVGIYSKPPVLWMGSLTAILLLSFIKDDAEESRVEAFFDMRTNFHEIMMGNAAYQSPEKALANGNDADGDRVSADFVPKSLTINVEGLNPKNFVDPRNADVAAGAHYYAAQWEKEMKGMVRDLTDTLGGYKVTSESFIEDMEKSVFEASVAKASVAIYTTHQGVTLNNRGTYTNNVVIAMKRLFAKKDGIISPKFRNVTGLATWMSEVVENEYASKVVSETIWKFACDVQGACVNFDAMNQVKDANGRDVKKLAEYLSAGALKFMHMDHINNEGGVMSKVELARAMSSNVSSKATIVMDTMFDKDAHNISFNQLINILPKDYSEAEVKFFLSYVMSFAGMMTGVAVATTFDPCQEAMRPVKAKISNIETLLQEQMDEKNKQMVKIACVSRTMINATMKFANKRLNNKNH